MTDWRTLTKADLKTFDDHQTKAVLYAMDHGGVGRISSKGHAIIRNQQGQTMSVSRSDGGRRRQAIASDLCRLFGAPVEDEQPRQVPPRSIGTAPSAVARNDDEPVTCPANGCGYVGATQGAVYSHIEKAGHHRCAAPGCDFVSRATQGVVAHRRIVHEGHAPKRGWRKPKVTTTQVAAPTKTPAPAAPATSPQPVPDSKPAPDVVNTEAAHYDAVEVLERVREVLGEDPRIAKLQEQVERLTRERDDALAQLSLVREALHLSA